MSTATNQDYSDVYVLLRHPERAAIYLVQTGSGWSLPHLRLEDSLWIRTRRDLNHALQNTLGLPVTALHCAYYRHDRDAGCEELVYVLENHSAAVTPTCAGRWTARGDLNALALEPAHHRAVIDAYLDEIEGGAVPALRPPWSRPGWFREASQWFEDELDSLGYILLAPIEHTNYWCLSCVLRARTTRGDVFFKAGPDFPLFVNETAVVSGLSKLFPHHVPAPLSIDAARRWMLLGDFGPALGKDGTAETRIAMLRQFARMQQQASDQLDSLKEIGCLDRRLHELRYQIDGLLADPALARDLAEGEMAQFQEDAASLKAACDDLAAFGIPETLNHGDLHLGNVAEREGRLLFYDWTDACIAHPFLDMISVFDEKDETLRERLRDAYLALWEGYASPRQLRDAWALAEPLAALHQAVSYQSILKQLEEPSRRGFGNVLPHYVRRAFVGVKNIHAT